MELTVGDGVFIIDFGEGENRTSHAFMDELFPLLDQVEAESGAKALVTTGTGKIYSNGLDVEYMSANPDAVSDYVRRTMQMCARLLTFPAPTAAAINGHAFGLGAFLAISHDYRVMRADRGFVCWPEVALDMTFPFPLQELNRARLHPDTLHEAMVTARRYGGHDALDRDIVHAAVDAERVVDEAVEAVVPQMTTAGPVLGKIKHDLHKTVVEQLEGTDR